MKLIVNKLDFSDDGYCTIALQIGADFHVVRLAVKCEDGVQRLEDVEPWLRDLLFLSNVTRNFAVDIIMAREHGSIELPRAYDVAKFSDLSAVARDLKSGIPASEVNRKYRNAASQ